MSEDGPTQDAPWDLQSEDGKEGFEKKGPWGRAVSTSKDYPNVDLYDPEIQIGRKATCHVQIKHAAISGLHCVIKHQEDGVIMVVDQSTNGTYVAGKKLKKGEPFAIESGTEIVLIRTDTEKISYQIYSEQEKKTLTGGLEDKYLLLEVLGTGAFATVKLCVDRSTGQRYAVKIIEKKKFQMQHGSQRPNALLDEVKILQRLDHRGIIHIHDTHEDAEKLFLILELVTGGDLFDAIACRNGVGFEEPRARFVFKQMLEAVEYLHSQGVVHRDLKPENILLAEKGKDIIKLSDFGLSRIVGDSEFMKTLCGTPQYLAPEVVADRPPGVGAQYDKAVDLWSLGVILYILLSGIPPFRDDKTILQQVKKAAYGFPVRHWRNVSEAAQDLVKRLMVADPRQRYTVQQALAHPWMMGFSKLADAPAAEAKSSASPSPSRKRKQPEGNGAAAAAAGLAPTDSAHDVAMLPADGDERPAKRPKA